MNLRGSPILSIELWHGTLLLFLLAVLVPAEMLEAWGLLLGGIFMGVNFLLLSCGIKWVLTPFAGQRRTRAGVFLLTLKMVLLLGLVSALFFRIHFDPLSFAAGISCLLAAIFLHVVRSNKFSPTIGE